MNNDMSNENKFTPGEWIADRGFRDVSGRDGNHTTRADDFLTVFMGDDEENYIEVHGPNQKANAALVEASPELLAILAPFIEIWAKGGTDYKERMDKYWGYDNLHKAKAAITKAIA